MPHPRQRLVVIGVALSLIGVSACSQSGTPVSPLPVTGQAGTASSVPIGGVRAQAAAAAGTPAVVLSGSIAESESSTEFLVKSSQCGYENVITNGSTVVVANGLSISAGVYAYVAGSGSCSTSVTAGSVTLSEAAPTTLTVSGTVSSIVSSSEFIVKSTQCGFEPVYYSSATTISANGLTISSGTAVSAAGAGSCSTSVTATSITLGSGAAAAETPTPSGAAAPSHIPIWTMDEYWGQGENATSSQVQQYVTYAEGGLGNGKASSDCNGTSGCSSVFYFDPNEVTDSANCPITPDAQFIAAASESWYVHLSGYSDAAHRIHGEYTQSCDGQTITVPVYAPDQANTAVQAYFKSFLQTNASGWNYYLMDNTSWDLIDQFYGPGGGFCPGLPDNWCSTTEEFTTNAELVAAHGALAAALPASTFTNGLDQTPSQEIGASSKFVGGSCENCVVDGGAYEPGNYAKILTLMAATDATPGAAFIEMNSGSSAAGSAAQIGQRLVTFAVGWLGYSQGHTIVDANLEASTDNLPIWPEEMLVPTDPVQSMTSEASDIAVSTNVWRREFAACYQNGVSIGPCAAILNGTSSAVTVSSSWLTQTYGHVITLSGGDIFSGGSLSLTSTAFTVNSTSVPADQAILLVR